MSAVIDLQVWLVRRLDAELRNQFPAFASAFDSRPPNSGATLSSLRGQMNFEPLQPWNDLISGVIGLRLGLEELEFLITALKAAPDGRAAFFYDEVMPLVASSCFERIEYVLKKLIRGKVIDKTAGEALVARVESARTKSTFEPLRHFVAHGPHLGLGRGGWLGSAAQHRFWELAALTGETGEEAIDSMLMTDVERRDRRYTAMFPFTRAVIGLVEEICHEALALAVKR